MKKAIIIVVILGMFGWAIYDFVIKSDNDAQLTDETDDEDKADVKVGLDKGNKAPDFELTTMDGDAVKLSDYRGDRVLLNFWATWCGPCRTEMPDMQKLYEDEGAVILAVNLAGTESSEKNAVNFVDQLGLTFSILLDEENEVASLYQIQPIPTTYMIDSNGIIHNKALGALNYEQMLQQYKQMD